MSYIDLLFAVPAAFLGFMIGRFLGGQKKLRASDRIGLGFVVGILGGLILSLVIATLGVVETTSVFTVLNVLFMVGGTIFGASTNWKKPAQKKIKSHIVYDFEDDDEQFDREIEEAFKGPPRPHKG
ncbi:MAG: hypothetical protein ACW99U_08945 [Candidatus Thorarchaeota archaeon]|jgi:hypothetical protein